MNTKELFEHNRTAYEAVMNHFNEGYQRACVVHATGTGKSYIINAVSDHFERVLIMTTNMFTIDEIQGVINKNSPERTTAPIYKIYQSLLKDMNNAVDYTDKFDLVVLDEFHHSGAEQWGKAIEWVIEQNPDAKVLGTSATAIRHSDGMRDMGEELFEGHVLSRLPLGEAWARKALVAPVYIMAVEDSEEFYNDFIKKIEDSNLLEEKKHYYREMARNLKDNYEMEKNAAEIIRKWLPSDSRRVIVFSRNIEEAESNKQKVEGWIKKAGFTIAGIYTVHSDKPHEVKEAQMAAFKENDFNGIKLMVAVDMLNEGVHIKGVDAVFFLRKTESPTIFFQQLGRCMVRSEEGCCQPVVFDFRNNVENVNRSSHTRNFFKEAARDYDAWKDLEEESAQPHVVRESDKEEKFRDNFPDGINYTMDYGIMLDRFGEDLRYQDEWGLLEEYVRQAEDYYNQYGKKISRSGEYENIGAYLNKFWRDEKRRAERPDIVERLQRSGFEDKVEEDLLMKYALQAEEHYIKHGKKMP